MYKTGRKKDGKREREREKERERENENARGFPIKRKFITEQLFFYAKWLWRVVRFERKKGVVRGLFVVIFYVQGYVLSRGLGTRYSEAISVAPVGAA